MIKDISEDEGLDGWVQEKIIKANDYLNTVREYLEGKQVQGVAEGADTDSIWNQYGQYSVQDLVQEFPNLSPKDAQTIVNYSQYAWDFVKSGATKQPEFINAKNQVIQRVQKAMSGQQGVAEGSRNAYLKHNNLVDIEKPLAGLKSEFEKFLQTHDPKEKQKYQQGIKQRIKSEPMSGPKGVLPEQGVAEGKRNLKCVCKTHGTMQCPVHTPKDIEVIENNKKA
jgi:hypothetical protein